ARDVVRAVPPHRPRRDHHAVPRVRRRVGAGHRGQGPVSVPYATLPGVMSGDAPALTAEDVVAATGGTLVKRGDRTIRGGAVDSRLVEPGNLFVALAGERTDGHRYLREAAAAGAGAMLVGRLPDVTAGEA